MTQQPHLPAHPGSPAYQVFVLALSIFALAALAAQASPRVDAEGRAILAIADLAVCFFFFVDFVVCFVRAPNRLRYMATWGWLDLLSSIPAIDVLRWGRAGRVFRILRVLRGIRASHLIAQIILDRRTESAFLAACLGVIALVVVASVSILAFEVDPASNIRTGEDALWWSVATLATVGYGDKFPVTSEGRLLAVMVMTAGVCLVGTLSGLFASWFLAPAVSADERGDTALREEVAALRASVERLREELRGGGSGS
jgi:voltage-gated potassium channel